MDDGKNFLAAYSIKWSRIILEILANIALHIYFKRENKLCTIIFGMKNVHVYLNTTNKAISLYLLHVFKILYSSIHIGKMV